MHCMHVRRLWHSSTWALVDALYPSLPAYLPTSLPPYLPARPIALRKRALADLLTSSSHLLHLRCCADTCARGARLAWRHTRTPRPWAWPCTARVTCHVSRAKGPDAVRTCKHARSTPNGTHKWASVRVVLLVLALVVGIDSLCLLLHGAVGNKNNSGYR